MTKFDQVRQLVADTLNISVEAVSAESSQDNLDVWDSLAQVNLVMALEQDFGIELEVEEFSEMNSVAAIMRYLDENIAA